MKSGKEMWKPSRKKRDGGDKEHMKTIKARRIETKSGKGQGAVKL